MPQWQPHQLVTEARLNTITAYLTPAVKLLDDINDAFGSSFLQPISKTTLSLILEVQVTDFSVSQRQ
jgi:energy-converting hydrogenase Eha subunit F